MIETQTTFFIPPDYRGLVFEQALLKVLERTEIAPYWTRRNKAQKKEYEVCYHAEKDVCSPVVVARFYELRHATNHANKLIADMLRGIANAE